MIKFRRMRWMGHVTKMGEINSHRFFIGKSEGRRPLDRSSRRWVHNVKMDHGEKGLGDID
jgi:hypothetical protein